MGWSFKTGSTVIQISVVMESEFCTFEMYVGERKEIILNLRLPVVQLWILRIFSCSISADC